MCFSANISFGSAAILGITGIICIRKVSRPAQLGFAAIPFLFALQQLFEGLVWTSFAEPAFLGWRTAGTYTFLAFAHAVWPLLIPLSLLLLEKNTKRRQLLFLVLGMALVLATFFILCLATYPVLATIQEHHIRYVRSYPKELIKLSAFFYGVVTIVPAFISTIKRVWLMGVLIGLSYITTAIFYRGYVVSVWCFFAALISVVVYWVLYGFELKDEVITNLNVTSPA